MQRLKVLWNQLSLMGAEMRVDEVSLADKVTPKLDLVGTVDQQFLY